MLEKRYDSTAKAQKIAAAFDGGCIRAKKEAHIIAATNEVHFFARRKDMAAAMMAVSRTGEVTSELKTLMFPLQLGVLIMKIIKIVGVEAARKVIRQSFANLIIVISSLLP